MVINYYSNIKILSNIIIIVYTNTNMITTSTSVSILVFLGILVLVLAAVEHQIVQPMCEGMMPMSNWELA